MSYDRYTIDCVVQSLFVQKFAILCGWMKYLKGLSYFFLSGVSLNVVKEQMPEVLRAFDATCL